MPYLVGIRRKCNSNSLSFRLPLAAKCRTVPESLDTTRTADILIQPAGVGVTAGVGVAIGLSVGVGVAIGLSVGVGEGRGSTSLHASRQASKACRHAA